MEERETAEYVPSVTEAPLATGHVDEPESWMHYEPPPVLTELPMLAAETIVVVVQSALENIREQAEVEKEQERQRKEAAEQAAETDSLDQEDRDEAVEGKGKGKAVDEEFEDEITASGSSQPALLAPSEPRKHRGRSRFGISRILRHVVEKAESREVKDASREMSRETDDAPRPTAFTQFVYKHIKASPAEPEGPVECVSCLEDISPKDSVKTVCHYYCKECFGRLIQTAVETEAQWPPKCCLNPVPHRTITKHIRGDLLTAYREKNEEFTVPIESRIYCGEPDCGAWIRERNTNRAAKTGRCPRGHVICTICRGAAHPADAVCPQDRDRQMADRLAEEEGWRRCYKCAVLVEHSEACQHMTCRCGAEFCYVCGARWCTCTCTMEQLDRIKDRARVRRQARTVEEQAEAEDMREILRQIEQFEAKEAVRAVEERVAREWARAERRLRAAEERAEREEVRRAEVAERYAGLRITLTKLDSIQRGVLGHAHDEEHEQAVGLADETREGLAARQEVELADRRAGTKAAIALHEVRWDCDLRVRVAREKLLEAKYKAELEGFWANKKGGQQHARAAMNIYMKKNDVRMEEWKRWKDNEVEQFRYTHENEQAIREELMDNAKMRLDEKLAAEAAELRRKQRAEVTWFEKITAERFRVIFELETAERETGGEPAPDTDSSSEDDDWEVRGLAF